ncbi:hypothetical protein [Jiulongibacter sp. NS-SX5]|uniref:hypothetical protein n=1 Tax=Jiulongibacter sp. NS-SX5 TaxID=3463854 RepID=UPI00405A16EE
MRILKYIALLFFAFFWFLGCSPKAAKWMAENGLVKDDYRYGDLYRMSNLSKFKEEKPVCQNQKPEKQENTHLVLAGDSFTEDGRMAADDFAAKEFTKIRVDQVSYVELDTSDQNILIIETVERHFRERFAEQWNGVSLIEPREMEEDQSFLELVNFDMPYSLELHNTVLFGYEMTMKIREWKSWINYQLFDRVDDGVALSKNGEHLLYHLPSKSGISSAFDEISDEEIDALVKHVNETQEYYSSVGFDKVILSVVPNKTSILGTDLGTYNKLVSRIQKHPNLQMPILDSYTEFSKLGAAAYALGDTHWSCEGQYYWLKEANSIIVENDLIKL